MKPERAEAIDDAKKGAVFAKLRRDKLLEEYAETGTLTEEEHRTRLRNLGIADRALEGYKTEIRNLYRNKGDDDE